MAPKKKASTIKENFSEFIYLSGSLLSLEWFGVPMIKNPFDQQMYQEILWKTRPTLVIETGTYLGGSALWFAHMFDLIGNGEIISIDVARDRQLPAHPRITYYEGVSSTDPALLALLAARAAGKRVMVVLDSDHTRDHVLAELKAYHKFVSLGCYLIVEDTNPHAYLASPDAVGPNGHAADGVRDWQPSNHGYETDRSQERLGFSYNPGGYLKRVR